MDLSCPQCGLQLAMRGPRHEYCPRCISQRQQPVPLIASSLFKREERQEEPKDDGRSLAAKAAKVATAMRSKHAF